MACQYFSTVSVKEAITSTKYLENGHVVTVKGWVRAVRCLKTNLFLKVNDGSTNDCLQVVTSADSHRDKKISLGTSVEVRGQIVPSVHPKEQPVELIPSSVNILGHCDASNYPFILNTKHSPLYARKHLHLRPRTEDFSALLRVRNTASMAVHRYFQDNGFLYVHTPIITRCDCEGAGKIFEVTPLVSEPKSKDDEEESQYFFGAPSYLTVSGQLQLESIACSMSKAYCFGPAFRAETCQKGRHLSEFYMAEGEMITCEDSGKALQDILQVTEELCKYVIESVLKQNSAEVAIYHNRVIKSQVECCLEKPFNRITYDEAIDILKTASKTAEFQFEPEIGVDLAREHEQYLMEFYNYHPVFVTDFPASLKALYAKQHTDAPNKTHSMDLIMPLVGEVAGGTVREEKLSILQQKLESNKTRKDYDWYLDLRRYGTVPHGGFGLGFDRLVQFMLGIQHIRDAVPFPRYDGTISL